MLYVEGDAHMNQFKDKNGNNQSALSIIQRKFDGLNYLGFLSLIFFDKAVSMYWTGGIKVKLKLVKVKLVKAKLVKAKTGDCEELAR